MDQLAAAGTGQGDGDNVDADVGRAETRTSLTSSCCKMHLKQKVCVCHVSGCVPREC